MRPDRTRTLARSTGEPRFHTDSELAALAYSANGLLWSIEEAGWLRCWSGDGRQLRQVLLSDLEDTPQGRLYRAEDLEGHRWMFMQMA